MMYTGTIFLKIPEYGCSSVLTIPTVKQTPIKTWFLYGYNYKKIITIIVIVYYYQQQFTYLIRVGIKGETALI